MTSPLGTAGLSIVSQPVTVLGASAVAVSCPADTTEDILATITVPAGAMGANGILRISTQWTVTNSANNKITSIRFSGAAGTLYLNQAYTAVASISDTRQIRNRNSVSSQIGSANNGGGGYRDSTVAGTTSSVDTSVATTIVITGQKASAGETLTLESYMVELITP
jgi:hypothetical protein